MWHPLFQCPDSKRDKLSTVLNLESKNCCHNQNQYKCSVQRGLETRVSDVMYETHTRTHEWGFGLTSGLSANTMLSLFRSESGSFVGATASALGGVRLNIVLSIPTAGGRPRGKRKRNDALVRLFMRQSGKCCVLFIFLLFDN